MTDNPSDDFLSAENLGKLRLGTPPGAPSLPSSAREERPRVSGQFLRGPIPLVWLETAARLRGGSPLAVALAIRFQSGRQGNGQPIKVTNELVAKFGVSKKSKYKALKALREAGLIGLQQDPKKSPLVTILQVPATATDT